MVNAVLIGGTSHAGKSTLARQIAARLGWEAVSTDLFARHPGRPWPKPDWAVPPHVAEHYRSLSTEELLTDVLAHYDRLWPRIEDRIRGGGLVLEGSALWPARVATLDLPGVIAIWLTASDAFLQARIERESSYATADADGRLLIESFIARTLLFNRHMMALVHTHNLRVIDVEQETGDLAAAVLRGAH